MTIFKKILKWLGIAIVILVIGSCVRIAYLIGGIANSCYENSEAVAYARSLSPQRLERLYYDMRAYSFKSDFSEVEKTQMSNGINYPEEFADLRVVKVRPDEGNIMIEGCFDHYVYLTFKGIGNRSKYDKTNEIVLSWGEHPNSYGEEVLWTMKQQN